VSDILNIDLETFSTCDLRKAGAAAYARHRSTGVSCLAYAFDNDPVQIWTPGQPFPKSIIEHVARGGEVHAWNALFEFNVWNNVLRQHGAPELTLDQLHCSMARAAYWGLPMSLDNAGPAIGASFQKDKQGHALMLRMSKPRRFDASGQPVWWHNEDVVKRVALEMYCMRDVETERDIASRLPPLPSDERKIWLLDARMNMRGLLVDTALVRKFQTIIDAELKRLSGLMNNITSGTVPTVTNVSKLTQWLRLNGVSIEGLAKADMADLLIDPSITGAPRSALLIRKEAAKTSTAKLNAMLNAVCPDNRVRGLVMHYGASRTGRWAGRLVQVQNLPRPLKGIDTDMVIDDVLAGADPETVQFTHGPVLDAVSSCLRACFVAKPGHTFAVCDFSAIEARVIAWLAGQQDILDVFASGEDVYLYTAAKIGSTDRQLGKVLVLACLAADTLVQTDTGCKKLIDVSEDDKVWDGSNWVTHSGLVYRGTRETISLAGTQVTPDHLVLCGTTWQTAQSLAADASLLSQALATASENLPSLGSKWASVVGCGTSWCNALAAHLNTVCQTIICAKEHLLGVTPAPRSRATTGGKNTTATLTSAPMRATVRGSSTVSALASRGAPTRTTAGSTTTAVAAFASTNRGSLIAARTSLICSRFLIGIARSSNWIASTLTAIMNRAIFASSARAKTPRTNAKSRNSNAASKNLNLRLPVYDLAHCGPHSRFTIITDAGPLLVHNCGFGMGPTKFADTAKTYKISLTPERAGEVVSAWREANCAIVNIWGALDRAARNAIEHNKETTVGKLKVRMAKGKLTGSMVIELPSGRFLIYRNARLEYDGEGRKSITYDGINQYTRKWEAIRTYGGKLAENVTQAVARCLLADAMLRMEMNHLPIVASIHDEVVCEVPEAMGTSSFNQMKTIMSSSPAWADGLPLGGAGWVGRRYGKG
jgi:DNA polymerase